MSSQLKIEPQNFKNASWQPVEILSKKGGRTYQALSPISNTAAVTFSVYCKIMHEVREAMIRTVNEKIKKPSPFTPFFRINENATGAEINRAAGEFIKSFKMSSPAQKETILSFGVSEEQCIKCVNIAAEIAKQYFGKQDLIFIYGAKPTDSSHLAKERIVDQLNKLYPALGMRQSEEPVAFTQDDLNAFDIQQNDIKSDPAKLSCLAYALLKSRELNAKELIFSKGGDDTTLRNIFEVLESWGYRAVTEPKPGNLIVYLDQNGKPDHVAVYLGDQKAQSKIGINNPYSHVHPIFAVNTSKVIFFQKNTQPLVESKKE